MCLIVSFKLPQSHTNAHKVPQAQQLISSQQMRTRYCPPLPAPGARGQGGQRGSHPHRDPGGQRFRWPVASPPLTSGPIRSRRVFRQLFLQLCWWSRALAGGFTEAGISSLAATAFPDPRRRTARLSSFSPVPLRMAQPWRGGCGAGKKPGQQTCRMGFKQLGKANSLTSWQHHVCCTSQSCPLVKARGQLA